MKWNKEPQSLSKHLYPENAILQANLQLEDVEVQYLLETNKTLLVSKIYEELLEKNIQFSEEPFNGNNEFQEIRKPIFLSNSMWSANCLDASLLFASICHALNLVTLLIHFEGESNSNHIIVGVNIQYKLNEWDERPESFFLENNKGIITNIIGSEKLNKFFIKNKDYIFIECTGFTKFYRFLTSKPEGINRVEGYLTFDQALIAGEKNFDPSFGRIPSFIHDNPTRIFQLIEGKRISNSNQVIYNFKKSQRSTLNGYLYNFEIEAWSKLRINLLAFYGSNKFPYKHIWLGQQPLFESLRYFEHLLFKWHKKKNKLYQKRSWVKLSINEEGFIATLKNINNRYKEFSNICLYITVENQNGKKVLNEALEDVKVLPFPVIIAIKYKNAITDLSGISKIIEQLNNNSIQSTLAIGELNFYTESEFHTPLNISTSPHQSFANFIKKIFSEGHLTNKEIREIPKKYPLVLKNYRDIQSNNSGFNFLELINFVDENDSKLENNNQLVEQLINLTKNYGKIEEYQELLSSFCFSKRIYSFNLALAHASAHPYLLRKTLDSLLSLEENNLNTIDIVRREDFGEYMYDIFAALFNFSFHKRQTAKGFIHQKVELFPNSFKILIEKMLEVNKNTNHFHTDKKSTYFLLLSGKPGKKILNEEYENLSGTSQYLLMINSEIDDNFFQRLYSNMDVGQYFGLYYSSKKTSTHNSKQIINHKKLLFHAF